MASLDWREIYERLARRPERPDPAAMAALEERVWAWAGDEEVAAETCAEVWRTFNLARGGASFEGFVHGRFLELTSPPTPVSGAERGSGDEESRQERLERCLAELRARNPRHYQALMLLYEERATVDEAADVLGVDDWAVRNMAARAKQALAECIERGERKPAPGRPGRSGGGPAQSTPKPRRQQKGHPPGGRRPR